MSEEQELTKKIGELGEQIKQAKADKKSKEEWDPILKEMVALKVCYVRSLVRIRGHSYRYAAACLK
jgi:uncharacterized coiled-coil DUF342 family protein